MVRGISILFTLIFFSISALNGNKSTSLEHKDSITSKSSISFSLSAFDDVGCDNCHDDDCCDQNQHCSHHCFHSHNYVVSSETAKLPILGALISKATFYFYYFYEEPFLDPSLKPPLFS